MTWLTVPIQFSKPFHFLCCGWQRSRWSPDYDSYHCFPVQKWVSLPGTKFLAENCLAITSPINLQNDMSYLLQNQQQQRAAQQCICRYVCLQPVHHPGVLHLCLYSLFLFLSNLDLGNILSPSAAVSLSGGIEI